MNFQRIGLATIPVCVMLLGCDGPKIDALQQQNQEMKTLLSKQQDQIVALSRQIKSQVISPQVVFEVRNVQYEIKDKTFEPLILGEASLVALSKSLPSLIYAELKVTVDVPEQGIYLSETTFHRIENGEATIQFARSLPKHNVKRHQVKVKIEPIGWYRGHST